MFGTEIGLDHVGIAVKDLAAAKRTFTRTLGFRNPLEGRLPNGLDNVVFYFKDATYIELLTPYDRKKAAWYASFLEKFQGVVFYVLAISDAQRTGAYLARHGAALTKPRSGTIRLKGETKKPGELWQTFFLKNSPIKHDPFFFIRYRPESRRGLRDKLKSPAIRRRYFGHTNSALRFAAVWQAVPDLKRAVKEYESVGFTAGEAFEEPRLQADGRVIEAGQGSILLLAPQNEKSVVARFIKDRGRPMCIGLSIEVGLVARTRMLLKHTTSNNHAVSMGPRGPSILLPPEATHGIWLELFQRKPRGAGR
jgi:catechol 2,3-dioxygenase-like lactoylglutathione lyase family enzyme